METKGRLLDAEIVEMFDKGELRAVKEVAYITLFPDQPGFSCCDECSWTMEDTYWTKASFCPGCGNPTKR